MQEIQMEEEYNEPMQGFDRKYCPVMRSVNEIGDKWTLSILRECFLGFRKFDEFQENLGISRSVLTTKLKQMVELGLLEKRSYRENNERSRYSYHLSKKGRGLIKVIVSLLEWGNEYIVEENEPRLYVSDEKTGNPVKLSLKTSEQKITSWKDVVIKKSEAGGEVEEEN